MALNSGFEYREQINKRGDGLRVSAYLARYYRHSSLETWRERLQNGEIFLDGLPVCSDAVLKPGQWLLWRRPPWEEPGVPLGYEILCEDQDLLAVSKPCGLPTVPAGGFLENTLLSLVRKSFPEAAPVHRLGRGTSGVVLFARTAAARSGLCAAMRRKEFTKIYRALASGAPDEDDFTIAAPIGLVPHPKLGTVHSAHPGGKHALSRVRVLNRDIEASLLEVEIETGRPHQIRIHLAFAGHPLVGDPLYTEGGRLKNLEALPGDCGYLLHAERLVVRHPCSGAELEIECPPPAGLALPGERCNTTLHSR